SQLGMGEREKGMFNWRYSPASKTVYWWEFPARNDVPNEAQKESVSAWLAKKGETVTRHAPTESNFDDAHGISREAYMPARNKEPNREASGWLLPDNKWSGLEHGFHEEDIADNAQDYNERFGTKFAPGDADNSVRLAAMNAGFVRVRHQNDGSLHIEANENRWAGAKQHVLDHALMFSEQSPKLAAHLIDENGHLVDSVARNRMDYDTGDYAPKNEWKGTITDALNSLKPSTVKRGVEPTMIQRARAFPVGGEGESYMTARDKDLFGNPEPVSEHQTRNMSPAQITQRFPEAVRPTLNDQGDSQPVPYNVSAAPLGKG